MYVFFFPTSIFISLFFIKPKDSNILYVLYVHFVQSDNALLANSTAHNERASSIYGTDVYTYICSTYNRTESLYKLHKTTKYKNILITSSDGEFSGYFSQNKFNFDDV